MNAPLLLPVEGQVENPWFNFLLFHHLLKWQRYSNFQRKSSFLILWITQFAAQTWWTWTFCLLMLGGKSHKAPHRSVCRIQRMHSFRNPQRPVPVGVYGARYVFQYGTCGFPTWWSTFSFAAPPQVRQKCTSQPGELNRAEGVETFPGSPASSSLPSRGLETCRRSLLAKLALSSVRHNLT